MSAFRPIFNTVFQYSIDDDALGLFFLSQFGITTNVIKRESRVSLI